MKEKSATRLLIVLLMASFAVVPMVIYGCGPEWARWDAAQANQYFRMGETEDALYQLRDAIKKSPRDPVIKLTLAQRLVDLDRPKEGLKLADEVLELYPDNKSAMLQKASCLQHMGEFDAALETWLKYDKLLNAFNRGSDTLNQVAYYRSLTGKNLNLARKDIEQAIASANLAFGWEQDDGVRLRTKAIALSGMIARSCDAVADVSPELSRQIEQIQNQIDQFESALIDRAYQATDNFETTSQITEIRRQLREYERELAVLLTVRALLRQDAAENEPSRLDRHRVLQLGFDASEIALSLPAEKDAVLAISVSGAWLDTRGFICAQLPWMESESDLRRLNQDRLLFNSCFDSALTDLNTALVCNQVHLKSLDSQLSNTIEFFGELETQKKQVRETIAVIRNHLRTLHLRAGNQQQAETHEEEIRRMGFEPGPKLF